MMTSLVEDDKPFLWNDEILSFDPLPAAFNQDAWSFTPSVAKDQAYYSSEKLSVDTTTLSLSTVPAPARLSIETPTGSPIDFISIETPTGSPIDFYTNSLSPKKPRVAVRVPIFDGEPYDFPVERLLALDASGIPSLAVPILDYGNKNGWSIEALLKKAIIGQYNTAVRYWFKGQNLSRQSVLEGAAVLVEWYESELQSRPRRNVTVDVSQVPEYMKKIAQTSKSKRVGQAKKKMITPSADYQPVAPTAKKAKFMKVETSIVTFCQKPSSANMIIRPVSPLPERSLPIKFYSLFDEDETEVDVTLDFRTPFQIDMWQTYFDPV